MWSWLSSAAWAACAFRAGPAEVEAALDAAERAYVSLDEARFQKATTEVDFVVPCLDRALDPALAARLHRLRGLGRFAAGDADGARLELLTARSLAPDYVFPTDMLPEGFELRLLYEGLPTTPSAALERLPRPRGGSLVLDGTPGRGRAEDRSVLLQRTEGDEVVQTVYLGPGDPVPWYPGIDQRRAALLLGAAGTAVVASGLYGAAFEANGRLELATGERDLESRARLTNALSGVSIGLFGAAALEALAAVVAGQP